jgi:hypothetical protein
MRVCHMRGPAENVMPQAPSSIAVRRSTVTPEVPR